MLPYILTTPFEVRKYLGCLQDKRGKFQMLCSGASEQLKERAGLLVCMGLHKTGRTRKDNKVSGRFFLVLFLVLGFLSSGRQEALSSSNPFVDKMHYFIFHERKKIDKFMS